MTNDSLRRWLAILPTTLIATLLASTTIPACKAKAKSPQGSTAAGTKTKDTKPAGPSGEAAFVIVQEPAAPTTNMEQGEGAKSFDDAVQEARVRQEKQKYLHDEYIKKGVDAFNHLDFPSARTSFASALEIDPSSQVASEWLGKTLSALGETSAIRQGDLIDKSNEALVRQAEARQKVNQAMLDGDRLLAARQFDQAIDNYRRAERILTWYPLLEAEGNRRKEVAAKIDHALSKKDASTREDEMARQEKAAADRAMRESQAREQLTNQLRKLFNEANILFLEDRHDDAIAKLGQLLEIDPRNERAIELRDIIQQAKNERGMTLARENHRKMWKSAFQELEYMLIPQTEAIVHDPVHWAEISGRKPLQFVPDDVKANPEDIAVNERLDTTYFEPKFSNTQISEIATYLSNLTQVNFIVSQKIAEMDEGQRSVTLDLPPKTSAKKFLGALQIVKNFTWTVRDGYVILGTPEESKGQTEYRIYDVSDLIQIIQHFPGPELSLLPPGAPPIPPGTEQEPLPAFTLEQITQIIQNSIAPETWTDADAKTNIRYVQPSGTLVVRQTAKVHDQLEKFLDDLREVTNLMVEVQTRFLIAEDNFLEDIGFDWRGLGDNGNSGVPPSGGLGSAPPFDDFGASPAPGTPALPGPLGTGNQPGFFTQTGNTPAVGKVENIFDQNLSGSNTLTGSGGLSLQWINLGDRQSELILRAVEKSERVELVTAPRLLVHSGERAHMAVTNQFAYVAGYGVEIAQASSIADPQIDVIQEGAILDVRPQVSADRKFVKLELRPTLATLKLPIEQRVVGVGNGTPVTIQFPNLTLRKVRTTVNIPDGGTLLLGGQSIDEIRNESSGVPILRDLPIIGFFFDRKGQSISKRRLVILLRVKVVIPTEYEPRLREKPSVLLQGDAAIANH
ncbi:MAG: hypothetical protein ACKVS6_13270 [Planctomycetota bacterium]